MGPLMATAPGTVDDLTTQLTNGASTPINILVLLTLITLLPGLLLSVTGFMRILIVLGFVRNALGTPTMPPNQVLVGISLFLTLFVMSPTLSKINDTAIKPWRANEITQTQALERAQEPLRKFMFTETRADIPTQVLIPAFVLSELKTAFQIGFLIFIPFLIIDMVVSATLMSMGMMMLPPVLISLPFKILLFVLVDGWHLLIEGLVNSFNP
jgi:flagellar biosynthetic protein FliP